MLPLAITAAGIGALALLLPRTSSAAARSSSIAEYDLAGQQPTAPGIIWFNIYGMKTSDAGIEAIKRREGFRAEVYDDGAGYLTIGFGHKLTDADLRADLRVVSFAKASEMLRLDLANAENVVNDAVTVPLEQHEFDALVSFVFNIGGSAFRRSTLLKMLNLNDRQGARAQFGKWVLARGVKLAGLVARRADESAQFLGTHA